MASYDPSKDGERREICECLLAWGKKLQMPQLTISTAIILFHRFYTKYTFDQYDKKKIGVTCLFLAGKIQETPKKIKDVIKHTYNVEYDSIDFSPLRDDILKCERILLQAISFEFAIEPPYQELVRRAKKILQVIQMPDDRISTFHQVSWNFVNDSLKTTLCLQYEPKLIACASIYLAMQYMKIQFPPDWMTILEAKLEDLDNISNQILDLYEENTLQKTPQNPNIPPANNPPPNSNNNSNNAERRSSNEPSFDRKPEPQRSDRNDRSLDETSPSRRNQSNHHPYRK